MVRLTANQIERWIAKHFEYRRRKDGEELIICNPFDGDTKFKFNISTRLKENKYGRRNYWVHDWRPSATEYNGSFIRFVQKYKGLSYKEALRDVVGDHIDLRSIIDKPRQPPKATTWSKIALPNNAVPINKAKWPKIQTMAVHYLESRGINHKMATSFKIHYSPTTIVFPYLEYDMIVYWQSRSFIQKKFEFPNQSETGIGKSEFLYGFDNAEPCGKVFITESIFDALSIGPGGLATGGAKMAKPQRRKLKLLNPSEVVLAPDNDHEGKQSIPIHYKLLNPYYNLFYVIPPNPFKDWNEMVCSYKDRQKGLSETRKYIYNNTAPLTLSEVIKFKLK